MGAPITIRQLEVDDAATYADLRREMLLDSPLAFASSASDDLFASLETTRERLRRASEAVIPIPLQTSRTVLPLANSTSAFRRLLMICAGEFLFGAAIRLPSLTWSRPAET